MPLRPRFIGAHETMTTSKLKGAFAAAAFVVGTLACKTAGAGGISLYEVGTADVGLASAGYSARAQDASTVFTNPAGMTRLAGDQLTLGAQVLYGDLGFSIGQGTTPALGSNAGGNPVGALPGGGLFYSRSVSPDFRIGLAITGNFGSVVKYDDGWVGRYRAQEGTLLGVSILPSVAWRVNENLSVGASLNAMVAKFENKVAVNNIIGSDGSLRLDDNAWGFGANLGLLYEVNRGTRFGITYNSPVKLDFNAQPQWSDLGPGIRALLASRGLLETNVDLGVTVPQGVNAGFYHEIDPRWAVLGSVGWQQWSKFGEVEIGVDSNNPVGLTTKLNFKDTWHVAGGVQYRLSDAWLLNGGIAYDSGFQDNSAVALALPANAAWRFGIGAQKEESKTFNWGLGFEYLYGGSLHSNVVGSAPVALGGRGDVVGSYNNVNFLFFAANLNWKF
jgi:long-chain fatty acid transport protein